MIYVTYTQVVQKRKSVYISVCLCVCVHACMYVLDRSKVLIIGKWLNLVMDV